jgi:hypothetical protein
MSLFAVLAQGPLILLVGRYSLSCHDHAPSINGPVKKREPVLGRPLEFGRNWKCRSFLHDTIANILGGRLISPEAIYCFHSGKPFGDQGRTIKAQQRFDRLPPCK